MPLPTRLAKPVEKDGDVLAQIVLDLTVYLSQTTVAQLDCLVRWYQRICPPSAWVRYAISETQGWDNVRQPNLTKQGNVAALAGEPLPFLAPVRTRIRAGRPFDLLFWDGRKTDTYTFSYRQIRIEQRKSHAFVRVTVPIHVDPRVLLEAVRDLADHIEFISGHGGMCFGYNPEKKFDAFTRIYPLARRYWGIDVENLNGTLPLMKKAIKSPCWLNLIGAGLTQAEAVANAAHLPQAYPLVKVERRANGMLLWVGDAPEVGDRHRPTPELHAMMALGTALAPLIVRDPPSFSGEGFITHDNTNAWFHRFDDPGGWS